MPRCSTSWARRHRRRGALGVAAGALLGPEGVLGDLAPQSARGAAHELGLQGPLVGLRARQAARARPRSRPPLEPRAALEHQAQGALEPVAVRAARQAHLAAQGEVAARQLALALGQRDRQPGARELGRQVLAQARREASDQLALVALQRRDGERSAQVAAGPRAARREHVGDRHQDPVGALRVRVALGRVGREALHDEVLERLGDARAHLAGRARVAVQDRHADLGERGPGERQRARSSRGRAPRRTRRCPSARRARRRAPARATCRAPCRPACRAG